MILICEMILKKKKYNKNQRTLRLQYKRVFVSSDTGQFGRCCICMWCNKTIRSMCLGGLCSEFNYFVGQNNYFYVGEKILY